MQTYDIIASCSGEIIKGKWNIEKTEKMCTFAVAMPHLEHGISGSSQNPPRYAAGRKLRQLSLALGCSLGALLIGGDRKKVEWVETATIGSERFDEQTSLNSAETRAGISVSPEEKTNLLCDKFLESIGEQEKVVLLGFLLRSGGNIDGRSLFEASCNCSEKCRRSLYELSLDFRENPEGRTTFLKRIKERAAALPADNPLRYLGNLIPNEDDPRLMSPHQLQCECDVFADCYRVDSTMKSQKEAFETVSVK